MRYLAMMMVTFGLHSNEMPPVVAELKAFSVHQLQHAERIMEEKEKDRHEWIHYFLLGRASAFADVIYIIDHQE